MKIRSDFVTNSSSVSYIISWNPDIADYIHTKTGHYEGNVKKNRIFEAVTRDLKENGEKICLFDSSLYIKKYGFLKKPECLYDESFDTPVDEVDFSSMDEKTLWAYIFGEYLVNGRLSAEFKGFGTVQIPRDSDKFQKKYCRIIACEACPRKGTSDCFNPEKAQGKVESKPRRPESPGQEETSNLCKG